MRIGYPIYNEKDRFLDKYFITRPSRSEPDGLPAKPGVYRQVSNIRRTLVGNKIVDHSDVVGASPVGAAPTTSSFSTNTWLQLIEQRQLQDETRNIYVWGLGASYIRDLKVYAGDRASGDCVYTDPSPRSDPWRARPGMSQIRGGVTKILSVKLSARDYLNVAYT